MTCQACYQVLVKSISIWGGGGGGLPAAQTFDQLKTFGTL